jgi:hypothetical protein
MVRHYSANDFYDGNETFATVLCPRYSRIELCDNQLMRFAASVGTVLDHVPNLFPFLSPGKWPVAMHANLGWQISFFNSFHVCWL